MFDYTMYDSGWTGFGMGIEVAEEVPAMPKTPAKAGSQTARQLFTSPFSPLHQMDTSFIGGRIGTVDQARESNSLTAQGAMNRATRKIRSSYRNYRKMRADGIVAIAREIANAVVASSAWTYEAVEDEEKSKQENPEDLAEYVKCVKNMWERRGQATDGHQGHTLRQFFINESNFAKDHGNHTLEVVYGEDEEGRTVITEFLPLLPENTQPLVLTGTRKFAGVRNVGIDGAQIDLDPEYCVRFVHDSEGGDLFGRSVFENCKDWIQLKWKVRDKILTDLNVAIGNIMKVGYPMPDEGDGTTMAGNENRARSIGISLADGLTVTYPDFSIKQKLALASANIDPSKIRAWAIDRLETGGNNCDGFNVITTLVDEQILFGMLVLPRSVKEAEHGAKADAEEHTDSMVTIAWKWITYIVGIANNLTDGILEQRYGKEARGKVCIRPAPIKDEAKAILKQIFISLLSDKAFAVKIADLKSGAEKLDIKLVDGFDQKKLVKEMDSAGLGDALSNDGRLRNHGYPEDEISKNRDEKRKQDAIPTDPDDLK